MIGLKPGVSLRLLQPQAALMAQIVAGCYEAIGLPCVITAGSDGTHMAGSLHYKGLALDFRTNHVPEAMRAVLVDQIRKMLGGEFDVVNEADHLHCEHDPKTSTPTSEPA